ncbi:metallophosphoesterase [Bordetella hinzii]|uniref:metallophosphoesterase n=1 Tax=Bordetella hinzii TaxID=103855 RepID=UPI003F1D4CE9
MGDLVDRGPESADVLKWLERPWFHAICGNHDLMTWRWAIRFRTSIIASTAVDGWMPDVRERIAASLSALPLAIEVETPSGVAGMVHADFPYDDWQAIHGATFSPEDEDACLWSVDRYRMQYSQPVRNVRAVIHGHMTLRKPAQLGNVYYIDTGGWQDSGMFTLLDLHTLKSWPR